MRWVRLRPWWFWRDAAAAAGSPRQRRAQDLVPLSARGLRLRFEVPDPCGRRERPGRCAAYDRDAATRRRNRAAGRRPPAGSRRRPRDSQALRCQRGSFPALPQHLQLWLRPRLLRVRARPDSDASSGTLFPICGSGGKRSEVDRFSCYHGVGHSVMMAKAYDLQGALDVCERFRPPRASTAAAGRLHGERRRGHGREARPGVLCAIGHSPRAPMSRRSTGTSATSTRRAGSFWSAASTSRAPLVSAWARSGSSDRCVPRASG